MRVLFDAQIYRKDTKPEAVYAFMDKFYRNNGVSPGRSGYDLSIETGGTGVKSAQKHHLEEYPYRLEAGTLNTVGIAGLYAGINWVMDQEIDKIHRHEMALTEQFRDGLDKIENVVTYCSDDLFNHIGVLSFNVKGFEAVNTATILDGDYNIACRSGMQCAPLVHEQLGTDQLSGTVRLGFGPFNTEEHVAHAVKAVSEIACFYAKKS